VIVPFKIDPKTARLSELTSVPTEEVTRSFNISPDGKLLVAVGQKSGNLATFAIDDKGHLKRLATTKAGINPWWVEFVKIPAEK
jgi:6-phosphogluconolactonase